jgi:predicted small integral membrane protein
MGGFLLGRAISGLVLQMQVEYRFQAVAKVLGGMPISEAARSAGAAAVGVLLAATLRGRRACGSGGSIAFAEGLTFEAPAHRDMPQAIWSS